MPEIPRLNGVIRTLEQGKVAFVGFAPVDVETAVALAASPLDGVAFEMEHAPMSTPALRDALQYMLDRRQILESGTLAPRVTPFVRIPPNGGEMNQWIAKQVLDIGVFGIIFPHVSTVEEARNAVGACRYPKLREHPRYDPPGIRGDAPVRAARYWGLSQPDYYRRADVWPLAPEGEILAIIQCEDTRAIENLPRMLREVKGIGVVLIGEGDLSQELGHPRDYEHPVVAEAISRILKICQDHGVPCGHPHPDAKNIDRLIASGYRFLMPPAPRSFAVLEQGRKLAGRI
jgi:4-hydroxy-2-oxoheptanedioate aldolase